MQATWTQSGWWLWLVLPILIFLSRILDQSIGTVRLIFVARGFRNLAPLLGFVEVTIWLVAVSQVFQHLTCPTAYVAYGAGFATGNYIGMRLEEWLSLGNAVIRIIPRENVSTLVERLRAEGFGVTTVEAEGATGAVQIIFTIVRRKAVLSVMAIIDQHNPRAFITVEDVRQVREGYFGKQQRGGWRLLRAAQ